MGSGTRIEEQHVGALATGFVAGQLTPDIAGIFTRSPSVQTLPGVTASLRAADDYGIRHMPPVTLTPRDDYATRHAPAAPLPSLTPNDDFANRH